MNTSGQRILTTATLLGALAAGVLFFTMELERYAGGPEGSLPVSFAGALLALAIARLLRTMARAGR